MEKNNFWPAKKALKFLIGSLILSALFSCLGLWVYGRVLRQRAIDPKYLLKKIIQTGPDKQALSSEMLVEVLGLNSASANYYTFSTKEAVKALEGHMLIQKARVQKVFPDTLYIDYTARAPFFRLLDYSNAALDSQARLIPLKPFFRPGNLCPVYLGLPNYGTEGISWGVDLEGKRVDLAYELYDFLSSNPKARRFSIERIDVSRAFKASRGQREVVVYLRHQERAEKNGRLFLGVHTWVLRLPKDTYFERFLDFCEIVDGLVEQNLNTLNKGAISETGSVHFYAKIIDLRIEDVCLIGG
jgi:hypothetical protein